MDLRQMEYLVALADEQQFTRAAAVCRVSQSGLSAAIRSLEDELGTTLFARTTRRVEPTDAGLALLPYARTMLAQATAGRDAVVRATNELSGQLRVGAEQCLGIVDVPSLLERFRRRYPLVDIHFTQAGSHDLVEQVRDGDLDVAFVAAADHLTRVTRTELGRWPIVLLCPPEHPLAASGRVAWADLASSTSSTSTSRGRCDPSTTPRARRRPSVVGCAARSTTCTRCSTSCSAASGSHSSRSTSPRSPRPPGSSRCSCRRPRPRSGWCRPSREVRAAASAPLLLEILDGELRRRDDEALLPRSA